MKSLYGMTSLSLHVEYCVSGHPYASTFPTFIFHLSGTLTGHINPLNDKSLEKHHHTVLRAWPAEPQHWSLHLVLPLT